jgi:hypothetical protein
MNFLDAKRIVAEFRGGPELRLLLALSGTGDPMKLFVEAAAAERGLTAKLRLLPFNTLQQALLTEAVSGEREVFLLLPWDLVPELDWRSGLPAERLDSAAALESADRVLSRIAARPAAAIVYLPAPIPAALADQPTHDMLASALAARAAPAGAQIIYAHTI